MNFSLNLVIGALVAFVAMVVGAACLSVSLITSLQAIDSVGEAWALGMAAGVHAVIKDSFEFSEAKMLAAHSFMNTYAPMNPYDLDTVLGKNWTDIYIPFLQGQSIRMNYQFATFTLVFRTDYNYYWMFSSGDSSLPDGEAQNIDWLESPDNSATPGVGEIRFRRADGSPLPPKTPEAHTSNAELNMPQTSTFSPIRNTLAAFTTLSGQPLKPACMWLAPQYSSSFNNSVNFELFGACDMKNSSGFVVGYALISLSLTKQLTDIILSSPASANGFNFIIDKNGYLIASSKTDIPYSSSYSTTAFATPPNQGCSNSYAVLPNKPPVMGCRVHLNDYAYAPLAALSPATYKTESLAMETVEAGGEEYIVVVRRVTTEVGKLSFNTINVIPKSDLLGSFDEGSVMALGIVVGLILFAVIVAVLVVVLVLRSLEEITRKMEETARLEGLDKQEALEDDDEIENNNNNTFSGNSVEDDNRANNSGSPLLFSASLEDDSPKLPTTPSNTKQQQKISSPASNNEMKVLVKQSWISEIAQLEAAYVATHNQLVNFTRYVPRDIVMALILRGGINDTTMQNASVTVSVTDVAGFTSIVEAVPPKKLSLLLKLYFERMTRLVMAHGGIVDRFVGDCIVGVWSAVFKIDRHELLGALCALAYIRETQRDPLKQKFLDHAFPLSVRVGVASGQVLAGNIGSNERKTYTVLGECVQSAHALEPYCKDWGVNIMISEEVARECADDLVLRLLTRAKLAGRANPIMCYEVMGVVNCGSGNVSGAARNSSSSSKNSSGTAASGSASSDDTNGTKLSNDSSIAVSSSDTASSSMTSSSGLSSSLPTTPSSNSNNQDDLVGGGNNSSSVNLEKLLKWHRKRTSCDEKTSNFSLLFTEAARHVLDHEFSNALQKLQLLETEQQGIHAHHKQHKSVEVLKKIIRDALQDGNGSVSKSALPEQFFVVV